MDATAQRILEALRRAQEVGGDKEGIRLLHGEAVALARRRLLPWLRSKGHRLLGLLARGAELKPERIRPALIPVSLLGEREREDLLDLFRLAVFLWSVPISKGYGRRLRFVLWDEGHGRAMGLLSLQSPPISLPARDELFSYGPEGKEWYINQTMDAHIVGALPPYNGLLGGKLAAMALAAREVREAYETLYRGTRTLMQGRKLPNRLVAITTISALGRSSIYNRLRYRGRLLAVPIGWTRGYGTFHLDPVYREVRALLEEAGIDAGGGFGKGPRRRWQVLVRGAHLLGLKEEVLRHGVRRQVFLIPQAENLREFFEGREEPRFLDLPFGDLARFWLERWALPRAERERGWQGFRPEALLEEWLGRPPLFDLL